MKARLDKILSESNVLSRSETKAAVKRGRLAVNGVTVKSGDVKVDDYDVITLDGNEIKRRRFFYIMMNKPAGYVCSTDEPGSRTVLDLLRHEDNARGMFPAGRLDKDTVGLLLITNDGALAHDLLSPKKHVTKKYAFRSSRPLTESDKEKLEKGVEIDGEMTKEAKVESDGVEGTIVITEGKFHQIKRMFISVGNSIEYLKRTEFGPLKLDGSLAEGEYRFLTDEETKALFCRE